MPNLDVDKYNEIQQKIRENLGLPNDQELPEYLRPQPPQQGPVIPPTEETSPVQGPASAPAGSEEVLPVTKVKTTTKPGVFDWGELTPEMLGDDFKKREDLKKSEEKRKYGIGTLLSEGAAGVGDAIASAVNAGYKANLSTNALKEVIDIEKQGKKERQDELEKKFMTDPNSGLSKVYQTIFAGYLDKAPDDPAIKKMSAQEVASIYPIAHDKSKMMLDKEIKEVTRQALIDKQKSDTEAKREDKINKWALDYSEKMQKNPDVLAFNEANISADTIGSLVQAIKDGNKVGAAALGIKMAKALGEKGQMSEADVTRYVEAGGPRSLLDKSARIMAGKPTDMTLDEIQGIANIIADKYKTKVQSVYDTYVDRLANNLQMPHEEAATRLSVNWSGKKGPSPYTDTTRSEKEKALKAPAGEGPEKVPEGTTLKRANQTYIFKDGAWQVKKEK